MTHKNQSQMDSLVTTEWLNEHLDDHDLVVLDCTVNVEPDPETDYRIVTGRGDYDLGHIAGARFGQLLVESPPRTGQTGGRPCRRPSASSPAWPWVRWAWIMILGSCCMMAIIPCGQPASGGCYAGRL